MKVSMNVMMILESKFKVKRKVKFKNEYISLGECVRNKKVLSICRTVGILI